MTAQSIFPTHRFVDWKIAGSEQWDESGFLLINMQDYAIDALGNQANDVLLDSILMANAGQSIRIHFPVGTFLFNETIQLGSNVILEGEGAVLESHGVHIREVVRDRVQIHLLGIHTARGGLENAVDHGSGMLSSC